MCISGNADVAGERVQVRAERPDVDIVNFLHSLDAKNGPGDILEADIPGQALEQDMAAFVENTQP